MKILFVLLLALTQGCSLGRSDRICRSEDIKNSVRVFGTINGGCRAIECDKGYSPNGKSCVKSEPTAPSDDPSPAPTVGLVNKKRSTPDNKIKHNQSNLDAVIKQQKKELDLEDKKDEEVVSPIQVRSADKNNVSSMAYIRLGGSVVNAGRTLGAYVIGIGYIRLDNKLFYGVDYSRISTNMSNIDNFHGKIGYKHNSLNEVYPFVSIGFGSAILSYSTIQKDPKAGISTSIEIGAEVLRLPIGPTNGSISVGQRHNYFFITDNKNVTASDLFVQMGLSL